jgi:hypothetical protein
LEDAPLGLGTTGGGLGVGVGLAEGAGRARGSGTIRQLVQYEALSTTCALPFEKSSSLRLLPQMAQ